MKKRLCATMLAFLASAAAALGADGTGAIKGCNPLNLLDADAFNPPRFEHYPAETAFTSRPAEVIPEGREAKLFRTRLREGAAKGPNFAGGYTVVAWGCGASCTSFAIVDAQSGRVYFPPDIGALDTSRVDGKGLHYRLGSRLLVVLGAPNEDDSREGITYYEWTGKTLKKVLFLRSMKKSCPDQSHGAVDPSSPRRQGDGLRPPGSDRP